MAEWNEPPREPGYETAGILRINMDFFELAAATGGDFYFWAPGEFGSADIPFSPASDPIFLAYGKDGGPPGQMDIAVDSAITSLQIFIGAQRLVQAQLYRPDGTLAVDGASGLRVRRFKHMLIASITDPEPGIWVIEVVGSGAFAASARYLSSSRKLKEIGAEAIDLLDFDFVELRGRPGHEGYFPLKEIPKGGTEQLCRVEMSGEGRLESLELTGEGGEPLLLFKLADSNQEINTMDFDEARLFPCRIPDVPFRGKVRGTDREGYGFARMTSGLITPGK